MLAGAGVLSARSLTMVKGQLNGDIFGVSGGLCLVDERFGF
jgi:hypothetical protein